MEWRINPYTGTEGVGKVWKKTQGEKKGREKSTSKTPAGLGIEPGT